jgi:type VI secretion system secreted protein VgrG
MAEQTFIRAFMSCAASEGDIEVLAIRGRERLGAPYAYEIDALVEVIDLGTIAGAVAYAGISDERANERHIHGVVDRLEVLGASVEGRQRVRFHLAPPQALLRYRHGFRIFQELSVPDIVKMVSTDAGLEESLFRWDIQGSYSARTYCVQYDESEWDFVCRLLEDEGIFFAFEHTADGVVMVMHDASDRVPALEPASLPYAQRSDDSSGQPHIVEWRRARRLIEAKVSLDDYDGLHPSLDLTASAENDEPHAREHYEYPGGYSVAAAGATIAKTRLEELASRRRGAIAVTDLWSVATARRFELLDHPSASGEHVVIGVELDVVLVPPRAIEDTPLAYTSHDRHRVRFECVPRDQVWRPARTTPRPRIHGVQTARVTGPAGEEIHCDEHGRVKLQFHWDLDGLLDDKTSLWIRPLQQHTTGSVMIPRIGWEVLVQFYDGDPDRPVVLGHLFNPLHPPTWTLPEQKTITGHRSNASPGAAVMNEVSFDDAAGSQRVHVNAGKDLTIHAVNHKKMQTKMHYNRAVTVDRSFSVGANETIALEASHDASVGADHTIDIGGNRTLKVGEALTEEILGSTKLGVGGMEHMQVGNPADAVIQIAKQEAINAAQGAAAKAASRVQGALLGPVMPALDAVNGAIGSARRYAGPAAELLGSSNPAVALYGDALGKIEESTTPPDIAGMAGGIAAGVVNDAFAAAGAAGGTGVWSTLVEGAVSEKIDALATINSAYGIGIHIKGDNTEDIGAARFAAIKGGYNETMASKSETVAVYAIDAKGNFAIDAVGAITLNVASSKMTLKKGYAAAASGIAAVTATSVTLDAAETVTLKCGSAEVIVDKSGIQLKGAKSVTIQGTKSVKIKPPAIGP